MAFWDDWEMFKVACSNCSKKFKKDELQDHGPKMVCAPCKGLLEEADRIKEEERVERAGKEEAMRKKLEDQSF